MNNYTDIGNYKDPRDKDGNGINDSAERRAAPGLDISLQEAHGVKSSFWDKAKRTLKGQNGAGKAIYGIGTALIGVVTGINIEPITEILLTQQPTTAMEFFTDINIWTIIFAILSAALGYLKTESDKGKTEAEKARDEAISQAQLGLDLLSEAKRADSEDSTKISTAEKDRIISQAEIVFKSIANYGGKLIIGEIAPGKYGIKADNVRLSENVRLARGSGTNKSKQ